MDHQTLLHTLFFFIGAKNNTIKRELAVRQVSVSQEGPSCNRKNIYTSFALFESMRSWLWGCGDRYALFEQHHFGQVYLKPTLFKLVENLVQKVYQIFGRVQQ